MNLVVSDSFLWSVVKKSLTLQAIRSINEGASQQQTKNPKSRKSVSQSPGGQQREAGGGNQGGTRTERERATIRAAEAANLVQQRVNRLSA